MEIELEGRVKPLSYKVKAMSRESPSQKASHVLDTDLRTHWSTGTNTKEWILLELDEPCLLSHIQIYNKSVLEWEIAVGLRYKPETFVKVRPRCEAPRRDMIYPTNYTPCRYVRISCLRGNPIAIFFIQLIGVSVTGLEPEFQPVVNHVLPQITSNKQDAHDMHLQLLQDITSRLLVFLPQLESDLSSFSDSADRSLRFLAMLVGPFYPILHIVNERETARSLGNISGSEVLKNIHPSSSITVSSNFEPRRSRSTAPFVSSASSCIVFRPDTIFLLLRKAYKGSDLGTICRVASRVLHKLLEPVVVQNSSTSVNETMSDIQEALKSKSSVPVPLVDYSCLFGEEFHIPDDLWDASILNVLDFGAVEEGILHVLYACASQPLLCHKLADCSVALWSALPLIQALLPALRPSVSSPGDHVDDNFTLWKQPFVQQALSQVVTMSCSPLHCPLLHACAGYLSSYSPSHAKAACVLIDLCSSVLAPWMSQVIAKIDLTMELVEDLLGTIQGARNSQTHARAALKYIVLAISGHMDDILGKYKDVKHKILFLLEMLEPFLDPAIYALKSTIAFGDVSFTFMEKQKEICVVALNVIRTAVQKPGVLPSLESEWRHGSVAPSVLLSILDPHMQLPPEIDLCKSSDLRNQEHEASTTTSHFSVLRHGGASKSNNQDETNLKADDSDAGVKMDTLEDASLLFATPELRNMILTNVPSSHNEDNLDSNQMGASAGLRNEIEKHFTPLFQNGLILNADFNAEYFNLLEDYFQLTKFRDSELKSSEFRRLALELHIQNDIAVEGHDAAVDALLLAAECYVNPFFMMSFQSRSGLTSPPKLRRMRSEILVRNAELWNASKRDSCNLETVALLEKKRDKIVLQLLLEAAELDRDFKRRMLDVDSSYPEETDELLKLSLVDVQSTDAITLVRQNQALLFRFLIQRLKTDRHSMHEILLHCLVFLLHSATQLYCDPEEVIDIILGSAEYLNGMLTSLFYQLKESGMQMDPVKIHGIQRRWILLQKLVVASSGGEGSEFSINFNSRFRCGNLIPPTAWMQIIPSLSCSTSPLVRFLGWMAVSRNSKQFVNGQLFLTSDLSQLTHLLSIYADELAIVPNVINKKPGDEKIENSLDKLKGFDHADEQNHDLSYHVIYPDLSMFIPNLKKQFEAFGENILNAVGLLLRSVSSTYVPDILSWFSDLISRPFFQNNQIALQKRSFHLKGYVAKNAKAIILCILEAVIVEHMEAIVPEIPRLVQVLSSLCRASYCDVLFLDSVMRLLKPIISYSLHKVCDDEKTLDDDSCLNFESLCFEELFDYIRQKNDNQDESSEAECSGALTIFVLATLFADLSFQCKREMLQSVTFWADFTSFEETTSFHDYLCAFQTVLESCKGLLVQTLKVFGVLPLQFVQNSDSGSFCDNSSVIYSQFLDDIFPKPQSPNGCEKKEIDVSGVISEEKGNYLSVEEIEDFSKVLGNLLEKLNPTIERCWNLHHHLAEKLTVLSSQCILYSGCLLSIVPQVQHGDESSENSFASQSTDHFPTHWKIGLKGLAEVIVKLQENNHWEVSSLMLDCILRLPDYFRLDTVADTICSSVEKCSCSAPKLAWRMRCDKWLSMLLGRVGYGLHKSVEPLTVLFITLLRHPEPEQRYVAVQHLGRLVGLDISGEELPKSSTICNKLLSLHSALLDPQPLLSLVVSSTWDQVVLLASSEALLPVRNCAMALLMGYIPYAARHQLQSFLTAADSILHVFGNTAYPKCEGPVLWLSLALLAGACLYSPFEDISLIPQGVWRNIEIIASSKIGDMEKNACEVLCKLRNEGEEAKEVLKELLSSNPSKHVEPDFGSTRESILQILANLTSVSSYFDMFSKKVDEEAMKVEEAEIELEIVREEYESSKDLKEEGSNICFTDPMKGDNRLQQIKNQIHSLEKSKLKEDILARRQKKLLLRRTRQRYLEEAALREEELIQELDRERAAEAEKEVERQRLLELEHAKTRELRHNLDIEKERQTQRELQRELEQAETGVRSSRRDFSSSSHGSRLRDRYRERENGRSSAEGSMRANAAGSMQSEISTRSSMATPTVVLSGSRPFSGQLPTILQSRDRPDEASSYEENFDGSRDSGDTGSVGDPDLISAFDGQSSGFGSSQRHGSRGSKSRQVIERRERDGRREGKWERKH